MIRLHRMNATDYRGGAELVFTNPYAPLPQQLHGKPSIISLFEGKGSRKEICEGWLGGAMLTEISRWGSGLDNTVYVANLPAREIDLTDLVEDQLEPGRGWFPLALPERLLDLYSDFWRPGHRVWDGFMGRGTVGAACRARRLSFIGIDIDPERVAIARRYLRVAP